MLCVLPWWSLTLNRIAAMMLEIFYKICSYQMMNRWACFFYYSICILVPQDTVLQPTHIYFLLGKTKHFQTKLYAVDSLIFEKWFFKLILGPEVFLGMSGYWTVNSSKKTILPSKIPMVQRWHWFAQHQKCEHQKCEHTHTWVWHHKTWQFPRALFTHGCNIKNTAI